MYLYPQMNETALSVKSASPSSVWPPSPRSVRHPATLTAVSRYSVRHLDSEVRQEKSEIFKNHGGELKRRIHICILQEFHGMCDGGEEADVSPDTVYFFSDGRAVIRKKDGERAIK